jgi:hypothetical protein
VKATPVPVVTAPTPTKTLHDYLENSLFLANLTNLMALLGVLTCPRIRKILSGNSNVSLFVRDPLPLLILATKHPSVMW